MYVMKYETDGSLMVNRFLVVNLKKPFSYILDRRRSKSSALRVRALP